MTRQALLPPLSTAGLLLAAVLLPALPGAAQAVELRYRFVEGEAHRYEILHSMSNPMPGGVEVGQDQRMVVRLEVLSVAADGSARLRQDIESVSVRTTSPLGTQAFDSDAGGTPDEPALAPLAGMVGTSMEVEIGADGGQTGPVDLTGWLEEILQNVDPGVRSYVRTLFDETGLEEAASPLPLLPPDPLAPGESWGYRETVTVAFGTIESSVDLVLREVAERDGANVAVIGLRGGLGELQVDPAHPLAGMAQVAGGDVEGELLLDLDRGILLEFDQTTRFELTVLGQSLPSATRQVLRRLP